jgi:hypothetical protein
MDMYILSPLILYTFSSNSTPVAPPPPSQSSSTLQYLPHSRRRKATEDRAGSWVSADELALPLLHIAGRADPRRAVPAATGQETGLRRRTGGRASPPPAGTLAPPWRTGTS